MKTYTICLIGLGQAVVIGGGSVAARKVAALLESGAQVTVISPALSPELESLAQAGAIKTLRRTYLPGDLQEAFLAIAATDDPLTNQAVWGEARQRGCLVNVVDDPVHSNFILPAVVRRGDLTLAVSTGGASPALAHRLRERLEGQFGPEYGDLARLLADLRPELMDRFPPGRERREAALRLVDSDLVEVIRREGLERARQVALDLLAEAEKPA